MKKYILVLILITSITLKDSNATTFKSKANNNMAFDVSKETFKYEGYEGSISYNEVEEYWVGKILNIPEKIIYKAFTKNGLEIAFRREVDQIKPIKK